MGWQQLENGDLMTAGEGVGFDVMVTGDKNLRYQQNLSGRRLAIVLLGTIRWRILRNDTASVAAAVDQAMPGSFEVVE